MSLYLIQFEGFPQYVEADSYPHAIMLWRKYNVGYNDMNELEEPESVSLVSDGPVIRGLDDVWKKGKPWGYRAPIEDVLKEEVQAGEPREEK